MNNRNRPKTRPRFKRFFFLLVLILLIAVAFSGLRNLIVYGRFFPDAAQGPGGEEKQDPGPPLEEPDPTPPEEDPPPPEADPVHNPLDPESMYLVADGDYLMALVTKQTTLGKYAPHDIVPLPDEICHVWKYSLREEAAGHLIELCEAAREEDLEIRVISAYRSYDTQNTLFQEYASAHGEEAANRFSARPGQSEHQLGTTVDFGGTDDDKYASFADTPQGQWLAEHAYKFGFVMSYPPGSEEVTGYIYEPWHFRYIGEEAAREWKESGKVLCEFLLGYRQQLTLMP